MLTCNAIIHVDDVITFQGTVLHGAVSTRKRVAEMHVRQICALLTHHLGTSFVLQGRTAQLAVARTSSTRANRGAPTKAPSAHPTIVTYGTSRAVITDPAAHPDTLITTTPSMSVRKRAASAVSLSASSVHQAFTKMIARQRTPSAPRKGQNA